MLNISSSIYLSLFLLLFCFSLLPLCSRWLGDKELAQCGESEWGLLERGTEGLGWALIAKWPSELECVSVEKRNSSLVSWLARHIAVEGAGVSWGGGLAGVGKGQGQAWLGWGDWWWSDHKLGRGWFLPCSSCFPPSLFSSLSARQARHEGGWLGWCVKCGESKREGGAWLEICSTRFGPSEMVVW